MNIEVEIRAFITEAQYNELIESFMKNAKFLDKGDQITYYFDCEEDLRIQQNNFFSKIWMKKGKIHDNHREEFEVKFKRDDFEMLERIFLSLGYDIEIKWFRKRHTFDWDGVSVCVDYTKGYGHIIELEMMSDDDGKDKALLILKEKLAELGVEETPKPEFNERYEHYRENWKDLVK